MDNARVVLDQIVADRKQKTAPDMKDDDFFEVFSAEQVLRHLRLIAPAEKGIVGKGNDGGLDAIFLFVNGRLVLGDVQAEDFESLKGGTLDWVLIQATREDSFKEDVLTKIHQTLSDVFDYTIDQKQLKKSYNPGVVESIIRFRETRRYLQSSGATISVKIFHVCKGNTQKVHKKIAEADSDRVMKLVYKSIPGDSTCDIQRLGARELADLAARAPQTKRELVFHPPSMMVPGGGHVCLVQLSNFDKFISEDNKLLRHLFESNVRDYLEDRDVNKDIRESLSTPTEEEFWMLNNGVTIIAEKVFPGGDSLIIEEPQIVNGLQTSEEIFNYCRSDPKPEHLKRRVLVRVIETTSSASQDRIIKATNRQNGISAAQLHATEQVHRDIERVFPASGLYYDRRHRYWQYKDKPRDTVISIQDLAQCLTAIYVQRPDTARARPGDAFSKKNIQQYKQLFSPDYDVKVYPNCARLQRCIDLYLKNSKLPRAAINDLRFYVSMIAAIKITNLLSPAVESLVKMEPDVPDQILSQSLKIAKEAYDKFGADDDAAKGREMLKSIRVKLGFKEEES